MNGRGRRSFWFLCSISSRLRLTHHGTKQSLQYQWVSDHKARKPLNAGKHTRRPQGLAKTHVNKLSRLGRHRVSPSLVLQLESLYRWPFVLELITLDDRLFLTLFQARLS